MTLLDYCKQSDKSQIGEVLLQDHEVKIGMTITTCAGLETLTQVYVYMFDHTYVLKSGSNVLWTSDDHGNPQKRSVFSYNLLK